MEDGRFVVVAQTNKEAMPCQAKNALPM
jgi:hypothetical protein